MPAHIKKREEREIRTHTRWKKERCGTGWIKSRPPQGLLSSSYLGVMCSLTSSSILFTTVGVLSFSLASGLHLKVAQTRQRKTSIFKDRKDPGGHVATRLSVTERVCASKRVLKSFNLKSQTMKSNDPFHIFTYLLRFFVQMEMKRDIWPYSEGGGGSRMQSRVKSGGE